MSANNEPSEDRPVPLAARCKFAALRGILWGAARCLSLGGLYQTCRIFGLCEWVVNYKRRRRFYQRMRQLLGPAYDHPAMRIACRGYFVRTRCDKIYYLIFDLLPRDSILERIHFPQRRLIDDSLAHGRGVYVALSHFGAQHVAGLLMCLLGYRTAGVRDGNEGVLKRYMQQCYEARFSEVRAAKIFYADAFPRDLYRCLKDNYVLGSALDVDRAREPHLKRVAVRCFGETREFLTGTMQIALRCQAPIHQGFVISRPGFHYELVATPPLIDPLAGADAPETLQEVMQRYADNIEAQLRRHPDHVSRI